MRVVLLFVAFSEQMNWKVITVPDKGFVRFLGNTRYYSICLCWRSSICLSRSAKHA